MSVLKALVAVTLGLLAILAVMPVLAGVAGSRDSRVLASPTPPSPSAAAATPPPAFRPSGSPVPVGAMAPHANTALGYSIALPPEYRRGLSVVDGESNTGYDFYVARSEQAERAICERDRTSSMGSPERVADLKMVVHLNPSGTSPIEFASAPSRRMAFTAVVSAMVNGREAAKIVHQPSGDTAYYVIADGGRLYEIAPYIFEQPTTQPKGWLDQIASSFSTVPVTPAATTPASERRLCAS